MNKPLSNYFSLNRRYSRSINLERDLERPEAIDGYILTDRAVDALRRIFTGLTRKQGNQAWTITSVYGTGKSAFAHYLACLCGNSQLTMRTSALAIAEQILGADSEEYQTISRGVPETGLFRAIATAQREPISHTIIRALNNGINSFWSPQKQAKFDFAKKLVDLVTDLTPERVIDNGTVLSLIQEIVQACATDVLLIIDELGKNLEYASHNQGAEDLYLLQQLAELRPQKKARVYLVGLLHQSFADYGERLASVQRNEWAKIQGRFEDIPFRNTSAQMMRLIGQAINAGNADRFQCAISNQAEEWFELLPSDIVADVTKEVLASTYPLHPVVALALPMLCERYAQNDRSLFTFLTSTEPYSFRNFLEETAVGSSCVLPTVKLARVYDYFIEAVGMGLTSRPNLQKWVEIQGVVGDAKHLDADCLEVLKTIGALNLVTTTGSMRATKQLVKLAMSNTAELENQQRWEQAIDKLIQKGLITHQRQLDELRIWQGSDFNVDLELAAYVEQERRPLVTLLSEFRPLKPVVAQRHSYRTGTLRYFERHYLDNSQTLSQLRCSDSNSDGALGYWVDVESPQNIPATTADGKPLILIVAAGLDILRIQTREFSALSTLNKKAPELQTDGVARREVRYRLVQLEQALDETLERAFDVAAGQNVCWIQGSQETISHVTDFNAQLSQVCDRVYSQSPILWNELINRRELTSQGAKARRELIEAMIEFQDQQRLRRTGYGPEVSIYYSLLQETGIHRLDGDEWGFYPPSENSKIWTLWEAIENFCLEAKNKPQTLDLLYRRLEEPPYGVKSGAIPVILAAILLYHVDDIGVYQDGTSFIPVLGSHHFELLVKDPSRFGVKYFEVVGIRSQVFKELEAILRKPNARSAGKLRNATLLSVITPLYQFVSQLPAYTKQTKRLTPEAIAVLQTLNKTIEPDELLFTGLPQACNLPPIGTKEADDGTIAKTLRTKLVQILRAINTAYDQLLNDCQKLLYDAFGVQSEEAKLREDLRVRSKGLVGKCVESLLNRFTKAAIDEDLEDRQWLEALVMIVADKPAESWKDEDVTGFEIKLSDLARRFKNLEALQKDTATKSEGFEARRITITRPDGEETHRVICFEQEPPKQLEKLVESVLEHPLLQDNPQLQQAFLAKLTERVFGVTSGENVTQISQKSLSQDYMLV
jgi:hypothetical protein